MSLSDPEIQSLRFHLGYGSLVVGGGHPYTPDGFAELFRDVIAPNIATAATTTASTAVTAGSTTTVTVASITDIAARTQLVVDVADDAEVVVVKAISGSTFTAKFTKDHTGTYPVAIMSGEARLRMLLWDADVAWKKAQNSAITGTAGLKSVGQNEVVWKDDASVLSETVAHYRSIVQSISDLVRVRPRQWYEGSGAGRLEAY